MSTIFDPPGINPPNPFTTPLQALINAIQTPEKTATDIITTITSSTDPATSLWHIWDAFFTSIATSTAFHAPLLALLTHFRSHPPTKPSNPSITSSAAGYLRSYIHPDDGMLYWNDLPRFNPQWRDTHDILEAWRSWDGVRTSGQDPSPPGAELYLNFCTFSAALTKATNGKGEGHPMQVFYTARAVLERAGPHEETQKPHRLPAEQVWALDVRVAATWVRDGGRALWEMDRGEMRRHWGAALDERTELWDREEGLTGERWRLWRERLEDLSRDGIGLDEKTRDVAKEAAGVVGELLGEN